MQDSHSPSTASRRISLEKRLSKRLSLSPSALRLPRSDSLRLPRSDSLQKIGSDMKSASKRLSYARASNLKRAGDDEIDDELDHYDVLIPEGAKPGDRLVVTTPTGSNVAFVVPVSAMPGMQVHFALPKPEPIAAVAPAETGSEEAPVQEPTAAVAPAETGLEEAPVQALFPEVTAAEVTAAEAASAAALLIQRHVRGQMRRAAWFETLKAVQLLQKGVRGHSVRRRLKVSCIISEALCAVIADVRDEHTPTDWLLAGLCAMADGCLTLRAVASGSGGAAALAERVATDDVMFGLLRTFQEKQIRPSQGRAQDKLPGAGAKLIFISHVGEETNQARMARVAPIREMLVEAFSPFHAEHSSSSAADLTNALLMRRVTGAGSTDETQAQPMRHQRDVLQSAWEVARGWFEKDAAGKAQVPLTKEEASLTKAEVPLMKDEVPEGWMHCPDGGLMRLPASQDV